LVGGRVILMKIIFFILLFTVSFNLNAKTGSVTGLDIPRFVSLKSNEVNLRVGPSTNYPIELTYITKNLPVEVIDEFDAWRKIKDHQKTIGWLHKSFNSRR
jgi:SH3-like domain-containing protein